MNILQIADYIYPQISGIGVTAMDIAQTLKICSTKSGKPIKQKIICINYNVVEDGTQLDTSRNICQKVSGIDVIRCKMDLHIASQPISLSYIWILNKIIYEFSPDIIIFHYPNPYLAEFLLHYKNKNFKLVVWWHSDIIRQKVLGKLFIKQNFELLRRADRIVATSPNYIDGSWYLSKFQAKCSIIPSCVREHSMKISETDKERAKEIKPHGKIMCFSMGRHVAYKGLDYLIEAGKYLDDNIAFFIGSSGPMTQNLMSQTVHDTRFHFTGHLSTDELRAYYYACDIFCFPSITRNEAFGLALADAMYYGKPSVTFTIPGSGVNFLNANGITGIECRNKDSKAFAEAIRKLASDENLRKKLGRNAHQRVQEMFTFEIFQQNVWKLLEQVQRI